MRALHRKLVRDFWHLRAQAVAIALVIAGGVATWVISLSTVDSLDDSQRLFYSNYRFAQVFANLERAPRALLERVAELPGVTAVEGSIRTRATLTVDGFDEPVEALIDSIPDHEMPALNRLHLTSGRMPATDRPGEALISQAFAEAHRLHPGDSLDAVIRGRWTRLEIAGIALSPEFIYQIRPGSLFPDHQRYAVLWMREHALEQSADMQGAFNRLAAGLSRDADPAVVIERIDALLERWGGTGAYDRDDHPSHRYLQEEINQLRAMARIVPIIFLGVAAFLLNIVVHRMVAMQRDQIAILKAFGYDNVAIGLHYSLLVSAMLLTGIVPGLMLGFWLGQGLAAMYSEFFRFPALQYSVGTGVIAGAVCVTVVTALIGTWRALWSAFRLPPAEAMRPAMPKRFRRTLVERLPLIGRMDQPNRMIIRNLERHPVKAVLAVLGIALATAILVTGRFQRDTIDYMLDIQFAFAAREDLGVTLIEAAGREALHEIASLPGVEQAEPFRAVAVEYSNGHRRFRSTLLGLQPEAALHRALDAQLRPIQPPPSGLLLTDWLADRLALVPGDMVAVRLLEGDRATHRIPLAGRVHEFVGVSGYMRLEALNRVLGESGSISGAWLNVEHDRLPELFDALAERPGVAASNLREAVIESFNRTMGENILVFALVNTLLAGFVAFGVIYNTARLALSERGRELASLRVLGFHRAEVCWILIGELVVLTLIAIPLGLVIGTWFCGLIGRAMASEYYRIPSIIHPDSYAFAAMVVLFALAFSGLAVGRRLYRQDLVNALKTRE